jgi:hypothetical protein
MRVGMDVWEKLTLLTIRWRRQPLQYLGCLHNATICMQVRAFRPFHAPHIAPVLSDVLTNVLHTRVAC